MKATMWKRGLVSALVLVLVLSFCSCIRTENKVEIKRNGGASITAEILMDEQSLQEVYGMPTNFYDAVETDYRYARVQNWGKEYINEVFDGVNYSGVKVHKDVSKKEVASALNDLYGEYASVNYTDKNVFGTRTITVTFRSNGNHLMAEELQSALAGELLSKVTFTIPGSIKSTTGTKLNDNTIELDLTGIMNGTATEVSAEVKFFDVTFFIPIGIAVVVVIFGLIFGLSKLTKNKKQNEGLTSINLKKKAKPEPSFSALDRPKSKMSFAKSAPKYTSAPKESAPEPAPAPEPVKPVPVAAKPVFSEPVVAAVPKPQAPATPQRRPIRRPSPSTFTQEVAPAPAPVVEETPVYEQPAAPVVEETPVYEQASAYEEPVYEQAPVYEEPVYEQPSYEETPVEEEPAPVKEHAYAGISGTYRKVEEVEEIPYYKADPSAIRVKEEAPDLTAGVDMGSIGSGRLKKGAAAPVSSFSVGSSTIKSSHSASESSSSAGYGSAKFSKSEGSVASLSSGGSSIFTPRSTAPNLAYGMEGYREEERAKGDHGTPLESGSTLFVPRSTAPNMNYGSSEYREEERSTGDHGTPLAAGSTLFTPRSTAPNMNYGVRDFVSDPNEEKEYVPPVFNDFEKEDYVNPYEESYEESYEETYEDSYYEEPSAVTPMDVPTIQPIEEGPSVGSIYQTNGYEASPYQSAKEGASEKSAVIKEAYGGSKLGSGAYMGESATGTKIGRSVGNIGGYVDEAYVNTSSYGSDPYAGAPLPKLGEMGEGGSGLFSIDSSGGFGGSSNTIGDGTFGSGGTGSAKYVPSQSNTSAHTGKTSFEPQSHVSSAYGKRFSTGGSGKFDFGMAAGDSNRKCPFCKEPIRDDDAFCVACGAELSRPYGSF